MAGRLTGNVTPESLSGILAERFSIVREVGRGGMATVFLATDHKLDRDVAVKVFDPGAEGSDAAERFQREITLTARLVHPHIVPLFDSGVAGAHRFFVMPFLQGETLRAKLARTGRFSVGDAVRVVADLCEALSYAHAMGIVHRDLKPENIFCVGERVLLADFGIATAAGSMSGMRLTATGMVLGTAAYMSPEQAMGSHALDGRSDLYALGCVMYELLTGEPPFKGINVMAVIGQHVHAPVPDVTAMRADVPTSLGVLLQALLAKEPGQRPATAGDVLKWLRPHLSGATQAHVPAPTGAHQAQRSSSEDTPTMAAVREGRALWNRGMTGGPGAREKLEMAKTYFERALALDPENPIALVGLGDTIHVLGYRGFTEEASAYAASQELRRKALALGDAVAEIHWSIGATQLYWEDDFETAGASFERAMALAPGSSEFQRFRAMWLKMAGRPLEALELMRSVVAHAPELPVVHNTLADVLMTLGRYDEAIGPLRQALKLNPKYDAALERLAMACHRAGLPADAASARRALLGQRGLELRLVALDVDLKTHGWTHARDADLERELADLLARAQREDPFKDIGTSRQPSDNIIITLAELGRWTEAMDWVERGFHRRPGRLRRVLRDMPFNPGGLAIDPRYAPMLRLAGLEELL
ncbi:MAG: protein kinase [Gemmatimonadetes bacterium]|nr:protein kinase [Gemmatimonadota bacterium]